MADDLGIMFAGWWPRFALAGGVVLLAGLALARLTCEPARRQRVGLWAFAAALVAVPLSLLPGWLPLPWEMPAVAAVELPPAPAEVELERERDAGAFLAMAPGPERQRPDAPVLDAPAPPEVAPAPAASPGGLAAPEDGESSSARFATAGLVVYVLVAGGLLARLLMGQLALARLWRSARPAPGGAARLFDSLAGVVRRRPELRVSDRVSGPICFGVLRPRVLLPRSLAEAAGPETLRWVFAHELDHLRRGDPLAGWVVGLAQALYWFCPWLYPLRRDLRLSQEYIADAAAVGDRSAAGTRPEEYAHFLVRLISARAVPVGAAGVQAGTSDLYRRITMLLKSEPLETRCPRRWSLLAGAGLLAVGVALAGVSLEPAVAADPPAKADAPKPEKKETRKLSPEERRKELEEKLKKLDINSPEYAEAIKEFEKLLEAHKPPVEPLPRDFPGLRNGGIAPEEVRKRMEEAMARQRAMMEQMRRGFPGGNFPVPFGADPFGVMRTNNGRLGVKVEAPTPALSEQLGLPANRGVVVAEVVPDSPAARAGIKAHDVLVEFAGKPVPSDVTDFVQSVRGMKVDEVVDITLIRKGKKETIKGVKLADVKLEAANPFGFDRGLARPNVNLLDFGFPLMPNIDLDAGEGRRVVSGEFNLAVNQNGLEIAVKGRRDGDEKRVTEIRVKDGDEEVKVESLDKVPEKYREAVKKLIDSVK